MTKFDLEQYLKLHPERTTGVFIDPGPKDWIAGVNSQISGITINNTSGDWIKYLPTRERQHSVYFDTQGCVTFSALNIIETILNYKKAHGLLPKAMIDEFTAYGYFDANGSFNFSDRYIAKLSGTTQRGNTLNNVAEAIRKYGLIPQKMWDYPVEQRTPVFDWNEFYKDIPQELIDIGQKVFLKWVKINWEWIITGVTSPKLAADVLSVHLQEAPIQVATAVCPGWNEGGATPVPKCDLPLAHATAIPNRREENGIIDDFDTYDPFLKMLAADYPIPWALKYVVTINPPMFELIKEEGSPAVYLHVNPADHYYGIADSEEIPGGDLLKTFSGTYGNAGIKKVPAGTIPKERIVGEVKAVKF